MIELYFDSLPPTTNHTYFISRRALYKTQEAKDWQEYAIINTKTKRREFKPSDWYAYHMLVTLSTNQRDVDSMVKIVQDSIAQGFGINDNRIKAFSVEKIVDKKQIPHITVWFGSYEELKDQRNMVEHLT
jgi:Holliday junction resolvase RusA-like endonuclease